MHFHLPPPRLLTPHFPATPPQVLTPHSLYPTLTREAFFFSRDSRIPGDETDRLKRTMP